MLFLSSPFLSIFFNEFQIASKSKDSDVDGGVLFSGMLPYHKHMRKRKEEEEAKRDILVKLGGASANHSLLIVEV